ncbi:GAF domain-containing protein [Deinococcus marmoris]|uniref:histidine kinase n=1 Tax=Deinococcus marmoris TaxID=249408 RepID=A0A1U7NYA1_9DEIO|nr:GAF domain-containing protein [Deinococcus marmoris]OLV17901.1 Phytochrome, two-component sensor histidine kinase [Deinococcus marmoris]
MTNNPTSNPPQSAAAQAAQLLARLQRVTQDLAAVRQASGVFDITLRDALDALGAIDGTVLIVQGQHLNVAARLSQTGSSVWQNGELEGSGPAIDALRSDTLLFFESAGALVAAHPDLETRTGGVAAVASAVLPLVTDGHRLGVIVLDFREPHTFTSEEQHFLRTLACQCSLALNRVRLSGELERQVHDRTAELEAFVGFTEAADGETDVLALAGRAVDILSALFPGCTNGYYALEDGLWKIKVYTRDLEAQPELLATIKAGMPLDTPVFARSIQTGQPVFVDGWDPVEQQFVYTEVYQSVATYPLMVDGTIRAVFALGLRDTPHWSAHQRAVFHSVGRSLALALERTETARQLAAQNAELLARTQALEGFAALTRDLGLSMDAEVLIERVMTLVLSLLPPGYAVFWHVSGGQWHIRSQLGEVGSPALQAAVDAGLPVGQTPSLDLPRQTREALFQDQYDPTRDFAPELVAHLSTVATLPVVVGGEVIGIFNVALFGPRPWSAADRAVLKTTARSLGLALERAEQARQLTAQRDLLQASNEELEAFTYSVSHDLRTPVRHIISFGDLLRRALPDVLDPKAERYFGIVTQAATALNTLIDGMLDVSRSSRQALKVERVALDRLFSAVCHEADVAQPERQIVWEIGALPEVQGDAALLRRVVTALIDNAVKYTRDRDPAVITVWAEDQGQTWAVQVRDNGVGFNPQYADKLFTMFQRLHPQEGFGGAAVSLANARRIVTRHGGTMTAEGQTGEGATFGFTLPKTAP